jgi:peptidoglycan/LPS O-acetylase OafA/YrhL
VFGVIDEAARDRPDHRRVELSAHTPRKDIQGLRAIAVIMVVLFHAGLPLPGGFVGVDVFFVISGFVITAMLMRQMERPTGISMGAFYQRRVRRLLPALAVVVGVTAIATALLGAPFNNQQEMTALTGIGAMFAVSNLVIALRSGDYFATPPESNPLLNMWSLSVEEQFYLVFPFVLILLAWLGTRYLGRARRDRAVVLGVGVLALASFVLCWFMSTGRLSYRFSDPATIAFYSAPTRAWEFAAGALLALVAARLALGPRASRIVQAAGLAGIVLSGFLINGDMVFPGLVVLLPVAATLAALAGGQRQGGMTGQLLTSRPMVWFGDISYSWYLWHWPLIALTILVAPQFGAGPVIAAGVSVVLAWASFRFIENPLRFDSTLTGRRLLGVATLFMLFAVGACLALLVGSRTMWGSADIRSMNAQVSAQHAWIAKGCNTPIPLGSRASECTWNAEAAGPAVYLLGDSQAGMLSEALISSTASQGRPLLMGTKGACPFITTQVFVDGHADEECRAFVEQSLAWLESQPPGSVVLSMWSAYVWLDSVGLAPSNGTVTYDAALKAEAFESGLDGAVARLRSAGHDVTIVAPIPGFPGPEPEGRFWYPYQCPTIVALIGTSGCGVSRDVEQVTSELAPYRRMFDDVAQRNGAAVIDLTATLCPGGACATNVGNFWRYLDGEHVSVAESERLGPLFAALR